MQKIKILTKLLKRLPGSYNHFESKSERKYAKGMGKGEKLAKGDRTCSI
jgi:hypothetical protein